MKYIILILLAVCMAGTVKAQTLDSIPSLDEIIEFSDAKSIPVSDVILLTQAHYDSLLMKIHDQDLLLRLNNKHLKMVIGPRLLEKRDTMVAHEMILILEQNHKR